MQPYYNSKLSNGPALEVCAHAHSSFQRLAVLRHCETNILRHCEISNSKLYNWAAVSDPRGLAPEGWHVATYSEWKTLVDSCLGGAEIAGKEMKEAGFSHWKDPGLPKYYGTNSSGLTCLPGGYRDDLYFLNPPDYTGNWWCANGDENGKPCMVYLYHLNNEAHFGPTGNYAVSVRCVRD